MLLALQSFRRCFGRVLPDSVSWNGRVSFLKPWPQSGSRLLSIFLLFKSIFFDFSYVSVLPKCGRPALYPGHKLIQNSKPFNQVVNKDRRGCIGYHCSLFELVQGVVRLKVQLLIQRPQLLLMSLYHLLLVLGSTRCYNEIEK